jgi:hypothetical protein
MASSFRFCGADGTLHDTNIIRCAKCHASNPAITPAITPTMTPVVTPVVTPAMTSAVTPAVTSTVRQSREVIDLSNSPAGSTSVFASDQPRFAAYDHAGVENLRQTPAGFRPDGRPGIGRGTHVQSSQPGIDTTATFHIQYFEIVDGTFTPIGTLQFLGKISRINTFIHLNSSNYL